MNATKVIHCGQYGQKSKYLEIDVYPFFEHDKRKNNRNKVFKESCPAQANLNDKRARRYFGQLAKSNFTSKDYHLTLTYDKEVATQKEADNMAANYIRRVNRRRKSKGLKNAKYLLVTELTQKGRVHHHLIISGGLSREEMEAMWTSERILWKKWEHDEKYREKIKQIGWANCDRLQFSKKGIEELCTYLCKDPQGKKRWKSSKNLIKPWFKNPRKNLYSDNKIARLAMMPPDCEDVKEYWGRRYKGYELDESFSEFNKVTGRWSIYLKMHLKE